ncbi:MAG: hypothetical protein MI974_25735, partial [Chitinophagales bacterium]|nr:hypothetical protein [Chitinophagales bacterium]
MKILISYSRRFFMKTILMLFFSVSFLGISFSQDVCEIRGPALICNSTHPTGTYSIKETLIPPGGYIVWEATPGGTITPVSDHIINVAWPPGTGTYLVTASIYDATGELVDYCELEVSVGDPVADASISPPFITICPGQSVEFTGISDCNDCTYNWTVSNNWEEGVDYDFLSTDDHTATIIFYTSNSTGSVQYNVSNSSGCSTAPNSQVFIADVSEPSFDVIEGTVNGDNIELCNGQEVFLNNTTVGNFIYHWQIIETATNQEWNYFTEDISFNFPNTGLYSITLTNYYAPFQSCFNSTTQTINVQEGIPIPIICPSVVCEGQTVTYEVEEDCTGEYTWTVVQPDGTETTETGNPISVTWSLEGSSFGTGYVIFHPDGCPSNFCAGPSVQEVPIFPSEFEMTGLDFICRQFNVTTSYILTSANLPGANYNWGIDAISTYSGGFSGQTLSESISIPDYDYFYQVEFKDETDQTLFNGVVRIWVEIEHPIAGCIGYVEKIVEVIQGNVAGPHEICIGDEAVCEFSPDPGRTINWSLSLNGDEVLPPTPGGATFTIPATALTETGSYVVSAEVVGDQGENCQQGGNLIVHEVPPPPEIEGQTIICPGTPYLYSIANCNSQYTVEWSIN